MTDSFVTNLPKTSIDEIAGDSKVLNDVFDKIVMSRYDELFEHAQSRTNFQIEKFIAQENLTLASSYLAMLKNRQVMAEGLVDTVKQAIEQKREFDFKWESADSEPVLWPTQDGGQKYCWKDTDEVYLRNRLMSAAIEIKDRCLQIGFMDSIIDKLVELHGGPFTREDMLIDEPVYYGRRLAMQAHDAAIGQHTGIGLGNLSSIRHAAADPILDQRNKSKELPDIIQTLFQHKGDIGPLLDAFGVMMEKGHQEVTSGQLENKAEEVKPIDFSKFGVEMSENR